MDMRIILSLTFSPFADPSALFSAAFAPDPDTFPHH